MVEYAVFYGRIFLYVDVVNRHTAVLQAQQFVGSVEQSAAVFRLYCYVAVALVGCYLEAFFASCRLVLYQAYRFSVPVCGKFSCGYFSRVRLVFSRDFTQVAVALASQPKA